MAIIATGQISIIDYNDALTLTGFIGSNHPKTQLFSPDTGLYTPNWKTSNLVLTPSLFKLGGQNDIITATEVMRVKWYEGGSTTAITTGGAYALSGTKSHILTVKDNVMADLPGKDWMCEVTYKDPTTKLELTHKMTISFSCVTNGGGIAAAIAWAPDGNVFKNTSVASLKAQCDLWKGSTIVTTNVEYQWYKQDASVSTDQGAGKGWRKLTETANMFVGVNRNIMTIYADAVLNYGVFKCIIKDMEVARAVQEYVDTISFIDNSDPIQVTVESSGGDVFKNGVGSTTLKARLFQAGEEVDAPGSKYTYTWRKFDKNGNLVSAFSKTGKSIDVGSDDVDVKATFSVEVR